MLGADAGIEATRDAGAFYPQPVGTLVALPALVRRGHAYRTYEVEVLFVSGDPLEYARWPLTASTLWPTMLRSRSASTPTRPSSCRSACNAEPLPALELTATLTVTEEEDT